MAEVDMNAVVVPSEEEGEVPHTMEEDSFSANPLNITTVSQSEERDEEERGGGGDKQDEEDIVELGKDRLAMYVYLFTCTCVCVTNTRNAMCVASKQLYICENYFKCLFLQNWMYKVLNDVLTRILVVMLC